MTWHELVEFTQVQKETACFQELAADIIQTVFVATEVTHQHVWVDGEGKDCLFKFKHLLRGNALQQ